MSEILISPNSPEPTLSVFDLSVEDLRPQLELFEDEYRKLEEERISLESTLLQLQKTEDNAIAKIKGLKLQLNNLINTNIAGNEEFNAHLSKLTFKETSDGGKELKGGTPEALIGQLYYLDQLSVMEYMETFFLTFRSFCTSLEVWENLVKKYEQYNNSSALSEVEKQKAIYLIRAEQTDITNENLRLRIVNVMKKWIEQYEEEELIPELKKFLTTCHPNDAKLLQLIVDRVSKKKEVVLTFAEEAPTPILPKDINNFNFQDLDVTELARQLTLIEWKMYKSIQAKELLGLAWQKKDNEQRSPNLLGFISRFNQVSNWITHLVVSEMDIKKRVKLIKKFLLVGEEFYKLQNYNGVFEIMAGLSDAAASRLQKTWKMLSPKASKIHEKCNELTNSNQNFKFYREFLQNSVVRATIPYMGLFLTDLTFVHEGNPNFLENGHVNYNKCRLVSQVILQVQKYQKKPYNFKSISQIHDYLMSYVPCTEKENYELSLQAEPRERS